MMSGTAPGKCADCGADAYIQLAVGDGMLCAHCYQDRLGLNKKVLGRKVGDPVIPKRISPQPRLS